jgi:NarL family two-component system response regulator LiaR
MDAKIRLVIADDHMLMRKGLLALMQTTPDIEVVGEAADGVEAVSKAVALRPDVILMDLMLPRMDGISAISAIRERMPNARILVLTSSEEDDKVFPAFKAGALGYMLKDSAPGDLLQAIRNVHEGKSFLHPTIAAKVLSELSRTSDLPLSPDPLTERELDVLTRVAQGMSNLEIAEKLYITEHTVGKHVSNILIKLHLANRTQVALYALRKGLVHLDEADTPTDS